MIKEKLMQEMISFGMLPGTSTGRHLMYSIFSILLLMLQLFIKECNPFLYTH